MASISLRCLLRSVLGLIEVGSDDCCPSFSRILNKRFFNCASTGPPLPFGAPTDVELDGFVVFKWL